MSQAAISRAVAGRPMPGKLVGAAGAATAALVEAVVARVCAEAGVAWDEISILDDPALADLYWEQIPVTLVDGQVHATWHVDPAGLRAALARPA